MKNKDTGLGKGLGALIPSVRFDKDEKGFNIPVQEDSLGTIEELRISDIVRNPYQPRKSFDAEALNELKDSIQLHGVIQPVTVRKVDNGFELIAGERRLRASQLAGLETIPANIISVESSQKMIELALIENIQRYDLNPVEEALAYRQLINECGLTQEQVATQVSKERSTVTNLLRLLKLPENALDAVRSESITLGHAKVLLGVKDNERIDQLAEEVVEESLSIKQLTERIKKPKKIKSEVSVKSEADPYVAAAEKKLRDEFGTDVRIKLRENNTGAIELRFYSQDDLNRILTILELEQD